MTCIPNTEIESKRHQHHWTHDLACPQYVQLRQLSAILCSVPKVFTEQGSQCYPAEAGQGVQWVMWLQHTGILRQCFSWFP